MSYNDTLTRLNKGLVNSSSVEVAITEGLATLASTREEVAASGVVYFRADLTSDSRLNLLKIVSTSDDFQLQLFEDSDATGGTIITRANLNRIDPIPAPLDVYKNPTVNDEGTLVIDQEIIGTKGEIRIAESEFSVVFAKNKQYLIKLTNNSNNTHDFVFTSVITKYNT